MSCNAYSNGSGAAILFGGTLPEGFCHTDWATTFAAFKAALVASLPGSYAGLVVGDATPAVSDQDKLWYRTSSLCVPLGLFVFYDGKWKRAIPHHMPPGTIVDYYNASLHATDHAANTRTITYLDVYDETYSAIADATDPFWRVCDGTNGTPDLRGRVRVGAGNNPDATISDRLPHTTTGAESVTLAISELPTISVPYGPQGGTGSFVRGGTAAGSTAINSGGNPHNNMQPSFCVYPIIRTSRTV